MPSGSLPANKWTRVVFGGGYYTVRYGASTAAGTGEYRTYSAPSPWPISSGRLPSEITHRVIIYGDVWLFSPVDTTYFLNPIFP